MPCAYCSIKITHLRVINESWKMFQRKNRAALLGSVLLLICSNPLTQMPANAALTEKVEPAPAVSEKDWIIESSKIAAEHLDIVRDGATYFGLSKTQAHSAAIIRTAFGDNLYKKAIAIAWCESRLMPDAHHTNNNGSTDRGLFQLNDGGTAQRLGIIAENAFDAELNSEAARHLYEDRGWQPWVCA